MTTTDPTPVPEWIEPGKPVAVIRYYYGDPIKASKATVARLTRRDVVLDAGDRVRRTRVTADSAPVHDPGENTWSVYSTKVVPRTSPAYAVALATIDATAALRRAILAAQDADKTRDVSAADARAVAAAWSAAAAAIDERDAAKAR